MKHYPDARLIGLDDGHTPIGICREGWKSILSKNFPLDTIKRLWGNPPEDLLKQYGYIKETK